MSLTASEDIPKVRLLALLDDYERKIETYHARDDSPGAFISALLHPDDIAASEFYLGELQLYPEGVLLRRDSNEALRLGLMIAAAKFAASGGEPSIDQLRELDYLKDIAEPDSHAMELQVASFELLLKSIVNRIHHIRNALGCSKLEDKPSNDAKDCGAERVAEIADFVKLAKLAMIDEIGLAVMRTARDKKLTLDERYLAIEELDSRYRGFDSNQWAELLDSTPGAIRGLNAWRSRRGRHRRDE